MLLHIVHFNKRSHRLEQWNEDRATELVGAQQLTKKKKTGREENQVTTTTTATAKP